MSQTHALATMPMPRAGSGTAGLPLVLIQVPRVEAVPASRARAPGTGASLSPARPLPRRTRRRRLRKEFRIAGYALACLLPLSLAWTHRTSLGMAPDSGAGGRAEARGRGAASLPGRRAGPQDDGARTVGGAPLPRVLLSIEAAGPAPDREGQAPVILPGYLLPDDNHEEASHEGS